MTDVQHRYGQQLAVEVRDLEVHRGEVLCLLGPTGAGKSTLLRLLAALESPTRGQIELNGCSTTQLPLAQRQRLGMVFQRPELLSGSVQTNVAFGFRFRPKPAVVRRDRSANALPQDDRVQSIMQQLSMQPFADRNARHLSGGQTQLVALARALVLMPDTLLLDEPTAHLDPAHVAQVERTIARDQRQRNTTVIWATHNLFQARRVSTRIAFFLDGQLIESACTEDFFATPQDPRSADFALGKMVY